MATIVDILASDQITNSRADINTSLQNLNSDKIETSVLDTDTTLAANSDAKVATQKAVKAYVDAGGNVNASEITKGIVEEATDAEVTAGTATGGTGAKLFITPAKLATRIAALKVFNTGSASKNLADSDGATQTIAHGLGMAPKKVSFRFGYAGSGGYEGISGESNGSWFAGNKYSCLSFEWAESSSADTSADTPTLSTAYAVRLTTAPSTPVSSNSQTATVAVDATNITITWTKAGGPTGTVDFLWEAET